VRSTAATLAATVADRLVVSTAAKFQAAGSSTTAGWIRIVRPPRSQLGRGSLAGSAVPSAGAHLTTSQGGHQGGDAWSSRSNAGGLRIRCLNLIDLSRGHHSARRS